MGLKLTRDGEVSELYCPAAIKGPAAWALAFGQARQGFGAIPPDGCTSGPILSLPRGKTGQNATSEDGWFSKAFKKREHISTARIRSADVWRASMTCPGN